MYGVGCRVCGVGCRDVGCGDVWLRDVLWMGIGCGAVGRRGVGCWMWGVDVGCWMWGLGCKVYWLYIVLRCYVGRSLGHKI